MSKTITFLCMPCSKSMNAPMAKYIVPILLMFGMQNAKAQGTFISNATAGWNVNTTWILQSGTDADGIPDANDVVTIKPGNTVTLSGAEACSSLTIGDGSTNSTAKLDVAAQTLTVSGNVSILASNGIRVGNLTISTGTVNIGGNLTSSAAGNAQLVFSGAGIINMTGATSAWSFSTTGTFTKSTSTINFTGATPSITVAESFNNVTIKTGSTTTATALFAATGTFTVEAGGKYIHNAAGSGAGATTDLPGATRSFAATSTVEIQKWSDGVSTSPAALPSVTWGNLIINIATLGGSMNMTGTLTTVNGDLTIAATGGGTREFRLSGNTTYTLAIAGNLNVSGGIFNLTNGTGTLASPMNLTIGGDFNQTGGAFTQNATNHISVITFTGGAAVANFTAGGIFTGTKMNWVIASGKTLANNTNFGAGNWIASGRTMTVNGSFQVNQGSFTGSGAGGTWTYGAGATLIYNFTQTAAYGPVDSSHGYWPASNGPSNVILQMQNTSAINAGSVQLGAARTISGTLSTNNPNGRTMTLDLNGNAFQAANLTVGNTAPLTLAGTTTTTITGNVNINANFAINGDLKVGGNWTKSSSVITFTRNSKAVFFTGSGTTQTITVTGGGTETFDYLLIDKATAGTVILATGTNLAINATSGNTFEIKTSASNLDLNGQTISFSSTGGNIFANGVAATINGAAGSKIAVSNGTKTFTATGGSWALGANVSLETNSGVNFGSNITTLNGTFKILSGGFASGNSAPVYASGSTLEISNGGSFSLYDNSGTNESAAWFRNVASTGSAQQGVPWNFVVSNSSLVNWNSTGGDAFARYINGNFTISSGSFVMSTTSSGNLFVRGNFTNNGAFTANGRTVTLNGTTQSISGSTTTFQDLVLSTASSVKTFGAATIINGNLTINSSVQANLGTFGSTAGALTLGGASQPTGTSYGGTGSPAANIDPTYFTNNTGYLNVGSCGTYSLSSTANASTCSGNTATIAVTASAPNLPVGTYMVFYTLTGANTGNTSVSMTVSTAGSGSFVTSALTNSGATTITIDYIRNNCVSRLTSNNTATITVNAGSTAAVISGSASICLGTTTNLQVAITGGTSPYTIVYSAGTLPLYVSGTNIPVSPSSTTNYTITSVTDANGCLGTGNSGTASVTLTTTTTTDGGIHWDNGAPTSTAAAVYDGSTGTISADLSACSLRLTNNATVSVASGSDVTLSGAITVDSGSTFTLNNNANLLQSGTTNANSGNIVVKRNSSALKRLDYTLWSSPVAGQGIYAFSPFTFGNRFYVYQTNTNFYNNADLGFSLTGLDPNGVNGTDSNNVQFAAAKGYLIRMPWDHPTAATVWNGTFTGVPNSGDIPFTMANDGAGFRFNLVGNPYPSSISIAQFVSDNSADITGTIYFWRETNGTTANNAYCSWAGGTFTTNGQVQVADPNDIIRTGQGFIVEALNASTSLIFKNGQRSSDNANQFFRNTNVTDDVAETNRFWLNLTSASGEFSQMAAGYMTNATNGVDLYDGKNINTGSVLLNSILDNADYAIQGKALPFTASDVIPLSYKVTNAGEYTIAIDHVDGLFTGGTQAVYLKDNLMSTEQNLQTGPYTFTSGTGTFNNRFEITYESQLGVANPGFTANNVIIYTHNNNFVINSGNNLMSSIKVFDIRGRLIQEKTAVNSSQATINGGLANGVLLIQITLQDGIVVTKKVIK